MLFIVFSQEAVPQIILDDPSEVLLLTEGELKSPPRLSLGGLPLPREWGVHAFLRIRVTYLVVYIIIRKAEGSVAVKMWAFLCQSK